MGGFIKVEVEKRPTRALNMQINKDIFYDFKVRCKQKRLPLNVVLEAFMNQYANGKYPLSEEKVLKWKDITEDTETLNSSFDAEIYNKFRDVVKNNNLYIRHVITAFVEDYAYNDLTMEFVKNE